MSEEKPMTVEGLSIENLMTLNPTEPGSRDFTSPIDKYSVGKEMTKKEVLKFIESLPEPNYFIRWDYKNAQYKMIEIMLPGKEWSV